MAPAWEQILEQKSASCLEKKCAELIQLWWVGHTWWESSGSFFTVPKASWGSSKECRTNFPALPPPRL